MPWLGELVAGAGQQLRATAAAPAHALAARCRLSAQGWDVGCASITLPHTACLP